MTGARRGREGGGVRALWGFFLASARRTLANRGVLSGRIMLYLLMIAVFGAMWRITLADRAAELGFDGVQGGWYVTMTEWILMSTPGLYNWIMEDIRSGDIAYMRLRPLPYMAIRLAEAAGQTLVWSSVIGLVGVAACWMFNGPPPVPAHLWPLVWAAGVGASLLMSLMYALVGLSSFWLYDVQPAYLITSKLMFVLGGLILPLDICPRWLTAAAAATPFPAMLYYPARIMLAPTAATALSAFWHLAAGLAGLGLLVLLLDRMAQRRIALEGG